MRDFHSFMRRGAIAAAFAALMFVGAGCKDAPPPQPQPAASAFDVSKTTCPEIPAARAAVEQEYADAVHAASELYDKAQEAFRSGLDECLNGIWKGGPCDKEWEASQKAATNAWSDISNDQFYKEWKKAKSDFEACHDKWDDKYEEWSKNNMRSEQDCQEEFQAKSSAARAAYDLAVDAARKKRDADNAFLDALEKKCKQPVTTGGSETTVGSVGGNVGGTTGGTTTPPPATGGKTTYFPQARACQQEVAGENSQPRTGHASDFGPSDILVGLMTQVAEDVTGTPLPTGAINSQIFAGIVCTKLHSRLIELEYEEIDAITSGNRKAELALRQKIARYNSAKDVWCKIAEGRPAVEDVKKEQAVIGAMPTGACKTDADCGDPVCCSASQVGTWSCNTANGSCHQKQNDCTAPLTCGGKPAHCVAPPVKTQAIIVGGKYIPVSQLHKFKGDTADECGAEEHWHANGTARATDGTVMHEGPGTCGFGKTKDVPVVEIEVPADDGTHAEIRFRLN